MFYIIAAFSTKQLANKYQVPGDSICSLPSWFYMVGLVEG